MVTVWHLDKHIFGVPRAVEMMVKTRASEGNDMVIVRSCGTIYTAGFTAHQIDKATAASTEQLLVFIHSPARGARLRQGFASATFQTACRMDGRMGG